MWPKSKIIYILFYLFIYLFICLLRCMQVNHAHAWWLVVQESMGVINIIYQAGIFEHCLRDLS